MQLIGWVNFKKFHFRICDILHDWHEKNIDVADATASGKIGHSGFCNIWCKHSFTSIANNFA